MKKVIGLIVAAFVILVLLFATGTVYTVREDQQAILTQFGKPVGEKPITEAGLHFKIPFIVKVNVIEKRVLAWDGMSSQMPTRDKTYIQVDTGSEIFWAAAPEFKVKVGDSVDVSEGKLMPMPDYRSKTLNRTFDMVYFAPSVKVFSKN